MSAKPKLDAGHAPVGDGPPAAAAGRQMIRRLVPLAALVLAIVAVYALDLDQYVSFQALRENRAELLEWVQRYAIVAPLVFMAVYAAVIALSVPGGAVLTIAGGFLFGTVAATGYVVVAATLGATIVFLIAKTALGDPLRAKAGPWMRRLEDGFRENALSYLLVLRLVPIFPFWLVNLAPAFLGVTLGTYVVGTFIGIIPGTFVYASVGNGLGAVFATGDEPDLGIIFEPAIITPIVGLAVLALLPVAYKKFKARRSN